VERHGGNLEGEPGEDEHQPEGDAGAVTVAHRSSDRLERDRAGEAVHKAHAVKQHAGGQSAEHEVLETRFGRLDVVAIERGDDVERQTLEFKAEIERNQLVGRDHHHHPERREQDQDRVFEAADLLVLEILHRQDHGGDRPDQGQDLHEACETVSDEGAIEGLQRARPLFEHQQTGNDHSADGEAIDQLLGAVAAHRADENESERRNHQHQFRQERAECGYVSHGRGHQPDVLLKRQCIISAALTGAIPA